MRDKPEPRWFMQPFMPQKKSIALRAVEITEPFSFLLSFLFFSLFVSSFLFLPFLRIRLLHSGAHDLSESHILSLSPEACSYNTGRAH